MELTDQYLEVDRETLEREIVFRCAGERDYAYLRCTYEAEREIERQVWLLASLADNSFTSQVTEWHWKDLLFSPHFDDSENFGRNFREQIVFLIVPSRLYISGSTRSRLRTFG